MITSEDGPWNIFRYWRSLLGVKHDSDGDIQMIPDKTLAKFFSCLWCISLWVAVLLWLVWMICPIIVVFLAVSTLVIIIDRIRE